MRWRVAAVALVLALALAWGATAEWRAREARRLAQAEERARLAAEGLVVAERAGRARLEREAASLREQLARIRRVAPGARVREVVRWRTREIEVPCPGGREDGPAEAPSAVPTPGGSSVGSALRIRIAGVSARVETRAGQRVAVGEVEVWRVAPPPEERIARVPWETTLYIEDAPPAPSARWAVGPAVGAVSGHWAVGAVAVGSEIRAWRVHGVPIAWVLAGGGEWVAAGGVAIRW